MNVTKHSSGLFDALYDLTIVTVLRDPLEKKKYFNLVLKNWELRLARLVHIEQASNENLIGILDKYGGILS